MKARENLPSVAKIEVRSDNYRPAFQNQNRDQRPAFQNRDQNQRPTFQFNKR